MVDRQMGMTPTLKMFQDTVSSNDAYLGPIHEVVRQFRELGGQLLFGTDVGYMTDYATEGEFRALARTGLDTRGILRMLTTAPALRFGVGKEVGTVTAGARADLVVLEGDPIEDLGAFARVRATVRAGQILYENPSLEPEAA
jgi:imidazolonepropionase-like amidohydrolase